MSIVRQSIGIWIILILFSLPFPLDWLPRFGEFFSEIFFPLVKLVIGKSTVQTFASDSQIYYVQSAILLIPSIFLGVFFNYKFKKVSKEGIHVLISYLLAFFLLKYGIIKLFQHQFYIVEPNIAYTPVGFLSKDILFWSSMGTSQSYNLFMGSMEIITGAILLSKRARMLGSIMALGVFAHVFTINVGFNITVKLLSLTLLAASVFLLLDYRRVLMNTFILHAPYKPEEPLQIIEKTYLKRTLKGLIVSLFIFECLYPFMKSTSEANNDFLGSYEVVEKSANGKLFMDVKRIHFHSGGYLISEDSEQHFLDHPIIPLKGSILFKDQQLEIMANQSKDTLHLCWELDGQPVNLVLKKLNNAQLPIYQDNFNWTLESMID